MSFQTSNNYQGLKILPIRNLALTDYTELLSKSFQNFKPTDSYLDWLYFQNPRGSVFGYDAYDGDVLVAHYACIPIKINGYKLDSLLSLNTATHPDYQGRGLFKLLASKTYEAAASTFANVIGVANSNSVGGFVKHLGFNTIGSLELRIGQLSRKVEGARSFSKEELKWRAECPGRPLKVVSLGHGANSVSTKPFKLAPSLKSIVFEERAAIGSSQFNPIGMTLDWRRGANPILKLPKCLKPSPLVLIFKPLLEIDSDVLSSFSFPDFDAF
jgi:hypothetical protein